MQALETYGFAGLLTFGFLMAWRAVKWMRGGPMLPEVSHIDMGLVPSTKLNAVIYVLGACLVAWPLVVIAFITAPED